MEFCLSHDSERAQCTIPQAQGLHPEVTILLEGKTEASLAQSLILC